MTDQAGPVFSALSDPTRRTVVEAAGLVASERRGGETHYRLTPEALSQALSWMEQVGSQWETRLAALRSRFPE